MTTSPSRKLFSSLGITAALITGFALPLFGASADAATKKPSSAASSVLGPVVDTRWGPVQVSLTVSKKRITSISVPVYPHTKHRSAAINDRALPMLQSEVLKAQSGSIQNVSGATVTWEGYTTSIQQAIDTARAKGAL